MNSTLNRGWRDRRNRKIESDLTKQERWEAGADVRAERARMEAEARAEGDRIAAEKAAQEARERVYCPCCGGEGKLSIADAERVFRAFELLPATSRPDPGIMAALRAVVAGEIAPTWPKIVPGVSDPRRAEPVAERAASVQNSGKTSNRNNLANHDFTDDGALIEV